MLEFSVELVIVEDVLLVLLVVVCEGFGEEVEVLVEEVLFDVVGEVEEDVWLVLLCVGECL